MRAYLASGDRASAQHVHDSHLRALDQLAPGLRALWDDMHIEGA